MLIKYLYFPLCCVLVGGASVAPLQVFVGDNTNKGEGDNDNTDKGGISPFVAKYYAIRYGFLSIRYLSNQSWIYRTL